VALAAVIPLAHADDDVAMYRAKLARGASLFGQGQFAAARVEFAAAYAIHAEPALLFNIASTYRREGEHERAIALYRAFLERAPQTDPRRPLAVTTISELEHARRAAATAPRPRTTAPPSTVAVSKTQDPGSRSLRGLGYGAIALATIGAGVTWFTVREIDRAEQALAGVRPGDTWTDEQKRWYARGKAAEREAVIWAAVSGGLMVTGVVLQIVGRTGGRAKSSLDLNVTGDGAAMTWSGAW
jgi:tetratricopeptide (TPR) repeat protein